MFADGLVGWWWEEGDGLSCYEKGRIDGACRNVIRGFRYR